MAQGSPLYFVLTTTPVSGTSSTLLTITVAGLPAGATVSFPDAYVAVSARQADEPVCTFDAGFKRLGVELLAS